MCPAKVEFGRKSFILRQGVTLSKLLEFSKLPPEAKKEIEDLFIVGVKGGFRVDAFSDMQGGGTSFFFFSDHVEDEYGNPEGVNHLLVLGRGKERSTLVLPGRVKITPIDERPASTSQRSHIRYMRLWTADQEKLKSLLREDRLKRRRILRQQKKK